MSELIATVTTTFSRDGKIKSATLKPQLKNILATNEELVAYTTGLIRTHTPPITARRMGEALIAKLFNKVTEIELADPDQYYIDSEMVVCQKYRETGTTKKCVINFLFKKR